MTDTTVSDRTLDSVRLRPVTAVRQLGYGLGSRQIIWTETFLFSAEPICSVGPTPLPTQWIPRYPLKVKQPECNLTTPLHPPQRLRMGGDIPYILESNPHPLQFQRAKKSDVD